MTTGHDHRYALPPGHRLGEYRIDRYLGSGGFGITYLATDENLNLQVAIKEYLPSDLAMRDADNSVVVKTADDEDDFEWGRERFLDEARSLARFNHPNIVRVQRFFEAHGTSYIVMDYVEGEPLSDLLERKGTLTEAEIHQLVLPLADGLADIHEANLLHRDIKPSNIIIRNDATPVLIDFGSARQAVGMKSRSMTSVVTPGYAPLEQYAANSRQGPATDIYAIGAVLYRCVTGKVPDDATERAIEDALTPATQAVAGGYSDNLLATVDAAMALRMAERPQSLIAFLDDLSEATVRTGRSATDQATESSNASTTSDSASADSNAGKRRRKSLRYALAVLGLSVAVLGTLLNLETDSRVQLMPEGTRPEEPATSESSQESLPEPIIVTSSTGDGRAILVVNSEPDEAEVLIADDCHSSMAGASEPSDAESEPLGWRNLNLLDCAPPDWVPLGKTPLERHDVRPGTYEIMLHHAHYQPVHLVNQALGEGRVLRIDRVLVPGTGAVTVTTRPRNAWVEHEGKRLADGTPVTLEGLPAGEQELTLGAKGHHSTRVRITIPHNGVTSVDQELERVPYGTLTLQLSPPEATVTLPKVKPVYQPGMKLHEGWHLVVVEHPGYQTATKVVEVSGDTRVRIELEAPALKMGITTASEPRIPSNPISEVTPSFKPSYPAEESPSTNGQAEIDAAPNSAKVIGRTFTRGSHQDDVLRLQGTPRKVSRFDALGFERWYYGSSTVEISTATKRVTQWDNSGRNLKVRLAPESSATNARVFTRGSHQDDVLRLQGTPRKVSRFDALGFERWYYGSSTVEVSTATKRVTQWDNSGRNLKVRLAPESSATSARAFTRGSHQDDVLRLQGTPRKVSRFDALGFERWYYGSSTVEISTATKRVTQWDNSGRNLKVHLGSGT